MSSHEKATPGQSVMIRAARVDEAVRLCEVEQFAGERFRAIGMTQISDRRPGDPAVFATAARHRHLLVCDAIEENQTLEEAVGFAAFGTLDGQPHLLELDVLPAYAGRRIGASLIDAVAAIAAQQKENRWLSLTTFRDVPWNGPYYLRLGFEPIKQDAMGAELAECLAQERKRLPPAEFGLRIAMRRTLT